MKELLALRKKMKARQPGFLRQDSHRHKRLAKVWRKPTGLHSKMRHNAAGQAASVAIGYRSPVAVQGLDRNGLQPVRVFNVDQVAELNKKTQSAVIGAGVGMRSRVAIVDALNKAGITINNLKDSKEYAGKVKHVLKARKDAASARHARKQKTAPAKKKEEKAPELSEEDRKELERKEAEKVLTRKE